MARRRVWNGDTWDFPDDSTVARQQELNIQYNRARIRHRNRAMVEKIEKDIVDSSDGQIKKTKKDKLKKKIESFTEIIRLLRLTHKRFYAEMDFLFCLKIHENRFLIFQDISSLPIKKMISQKVNHSVGFYAKWTPPPMPKKKGKKTEYVEWGEKGEENEFLKLLKAHMEVTNSGYFENSMIANLFSNSPNKYNPSLQFRIEDIYMINVASGFFEIYSDTISLIGLKKRSDFPHKMENRRNNIGVGWTNCKFTLSYDFEKSTFVPSTITKYFWVHKRFESDKEDDKIIDRLVLGNESQQIKNVGQRDLSDILIEDDDK